MRKAILILSLAASAPLLAAGGGGGGGGMSMPSQSAPSYDPAEEYRKGVAAIQAKDYKTAKAALDKVISSAPKNASAQYLAGLARTGLDDWKGARRFFEKAVKLDPAMTVAWEKLGVTQAKLGDRAKAEETLAAIRSRVAQCGACADATALQTAETAISAALSGTPTAMMTPSLLFSAQAGDARYLEAVALINDKRYEAALASLAASARALGPHPDILTYQGFANRKLKRFALAEDYYRQALAIAPGHRGATEYFGELMVERGDMAGARLMLAKLDAQCRFSCAEAEELRAWIAAGRSPHS